MMGLQQQQQQAMLSPGGRGFGMMGGMGGMMGMGMGSSLFLSSPRSLANASSRAQVAWDLLVALLARTTAPPAARRTSPRPSAQARTQTRPSTSPSLVISPPGFARSDFTSTRPTLRGRTGARWSFSTMRDSRARGFRRSVLGGSCSSALPFSLRARIHADDGAHRVFETVRGKMNMALPGDGVPGAYDGGSTRSESPPPERDP